MSMAPTKLLQEEHDRIFSHVIVPKSLINDIEATDPPRAIILAGQPGAGKGGLTKEALKEMGGNVVIVDTDECRDAHPRVEEFRKQHPYDWGDDTHPDASAWSKELLKKAMDEGKNIIYDTTLSDGDKAAALMKQLTEKGYQVEVRAIATSSIESELGVDQHFTGSVDRNGFGRFVPQNVREEIYDALPGSLNTVAKEVPDVPISIYNRQLDKVFDSREDKGSPGQALTEERNRRFADPDILQEAHQGWSAQQKWHQGFPESYQANKALDEETAQNLIRERKQHQVVELVDRMTDASFRYLQEVKPSAEPQHKPANEQQQGLGNQQVNDDPIVVKPKSL
jgi:hypothetical protein